MNLVLDIENLKFENIFFNESVKNTVMNDSSFIRILYSNKHFTLNGIFTKILFSPYEHYSQKRTDNEYNLKMISLIEQLEKYILTVYNSNKIKVYKIIDQLHYIISKSPTDKRRNPLSLILKISGIWETNTQIGITYKFIDINRL